MNSVSEKARSIFKLKKITAAPLHICQKAYDESNGDMEKALETIEKQCRIIADKKLLSSDSSQEGVIGAAKLSDGRIVAAKVYAVTDFVTKNEVFQTTVKEILKQLSNINSTGDVTQIVNGEEKILDIIKGAVSKLGEPIRLGEAKIYEPQGGELFLYVHNCYSRMSEEGYEGEIGRILAVVELSGNRPISISEGMDICLHVAAMKPQYLSIHDIDPELVRGKREALYNEEKEKGKPANMIENIVDAKLKKSLGELSLLTQEFVKDESITVEEYAREKSITIHRFFYESL